MNCMMFGFAVLVAFAAVAVAFPQEAGRTKCGYSTCGMNSRCTKVNGYDGCVCNSGFFGSGYGEGCTAEPQCRNDTDCKDDEFCNSDNLCARSCLYKCPADVGCIARNHAVECLFTGDLFFDPHAPTSAPSTGDPPKDAVSSSSAAPSGGSTTPATPVKAHNP